jgi:hypothetical protein
MGSTKARFAAGTPEGPSGTVFSLFTGASGDVYITARSLNNDLKVSLHQSGDWRHAFTVDGVERLPEELRPDDRTLERWDRPAEFSPGFTRALQIVVHPEDVDNPELTSIDPEKVTWMPPPAEDEVGYFSVLLQGPDASPPPGWPGRKTMGTEFVHREPLGNDETTWVLWHVEKRSSRLEEDRGDLLRKAAVGLVNRISAGEIPAERLAALSKPSYRLLGMGVDEGTAALTDLSMRAVLPVMRELVAKDPPEPGDQ